MRLSGNDGSDPDVDAWGDGELHPAIAAIIARARAAGIPALHAGTPAAARAIIAAGRPALGDGPDMRVDRIEVPTRNGAIPALLCLPSPAPAGLCVYLHGGGWVISTPADYETLARTLAARSGCALLVPDYRKAPEHRFPAGLEDCEDAIRWADRERAALAGSNAAPGAAPGAGLVLAGDSAGGNLATVCAARLAQTVPLAGQVLVYPVTDADFETESYRRFGAGLPLQAEDMRWFFEHYAPADAWSTPDIAPLHADRLESLPPTVVLLAELDVLRDEGEAYARRLQAASRLVALHRYRGVTHGFIRLHNLVDTADRAVTDLAAAIAALAAAAPPRR